MKKTTSQTKTIFETEIIEENMTTTMQPKIMDLASEGVTTKPFIDEESTIKSIKDDTDTSFESKSSTLSTMSTVTRVSNNIL